jgi:hypothetical protein
MGEKWGKGVEIPDWNVDNSGFGFVEKICLAEPISGTISGF